MCLFLFIDICKVPKEVLKSKGLPERLAMLLNDKFKIVFVVY